MWGRDRMAVYPWDHPTDPRIRLCRAFSARRFLYAIPRPRGLSLGYNISPLRGSTRLRPFHSLRLRKIGARRAVGPAKADSSAVGFVSDPFVLIRVPIRVHSWSFFAPSASAKPSARQVFAAIPFSRPAGEAVGAPILGADTVVYEEKAGGIVFFFDGF